MTSLLNLILKLWLVLAWPVWRPAAKLSIKRELESCRVPWRNDDNSNNEGRRKLERCYVYGLDGSNDFMGVFLSPNSSSYIMKYA